MYNIYWSSLNAVCVLVCEVLKVLTQVPRRHRENKRQIVFTLPLSV